MAAQRSRHLAAQSAAAAANPAHRAAAPAADATQRLATAQQPDLKTDAPVSPSGGDSDAADAPPLSRSEPRWHDLGQSGNSGNSTSGIGTSVGPAGISGGTTEGGETRWTDAAPAAASPGDELLHLLNAIELRGKQLYSENRQYAEVLSSSRSVLNVDVTEATDDVTEGASASVTRSYNDNVTLKCRYCERPLASRPAAPTPGLSDPTRYTRSRDPVTDALNLNLNLGQSPLLHGHPTIPERRASAAVGGSRLAGVGGSSPQLHPHPSAADPSPFSLPVFRPREEYMSALTEVERLMQERDLLLERLLGMELVAVRSQGQAASLQTRLQAVTAANEELRRELRLLTSGHDQKDPSRDLREPREVLRARRGSQPGPSGPSPARSTPDLRPPSRIPQPLSLRKRADWSQPPSFHTRSGHVTSRLAGVTTSQQQTQTSESLLQSSVTLTPGALDMASGRLSGASVNAGPALAQVTVTPVNTAQVTVTPVNAAVGVSEASVNGDTAEVTVTPVNVGVQTVNGRVVKVRPDRTRMIAILNEADPLKLQKQLLMALVETERLRGQAGMAAAGGVGSHQVSEEISARIASLRRDNELLKTQLSECRAELEAARARLHPHDTPTTSPSGNTRPARPLEAARSVEPLPARRWGRASLSASPHDQRSLGQSSIPVPVRAPSPASRLAGSPGSAAGQRARTATRPGQATSPGGRGSGSPGGVARGQGDGAGMTRASGGQTSGKSAGRVTETVPRHRSGNRADTPTKSGNNAGTPTRSGNRADTPTRSGNRSDTPTRSGSRSDTPTRSGNRSQTPTRSSELATVRAMRQLSSTLRSAGSRGSLIENEIPDAGGCGDSKVAPETIPDSAGKQQEARKKDWRSSFPDVSGVSTAADLWPDTTRAGPRRPVSGTDSPAKIPAVQSQALGQILSALSRGGARLDSAGGPRNEAAVEALSRTAADIRRLREEMELRLRQTRLLETSDGEVQTDSLTSAPLSEDEESASLDLMLDLGPPAGRRRRGGLLERLGVLDSNGATESRAAMESRFGYRYTGVTRPDPVSPPTINQGVVVNAAPPTGGQRLQKSASVKSPSGEERVRVVRSSTVREVSSRNKETSSNTPPQQQQQQQQQQQRPVKESGNARMGRYIRSLLHRISEVPDQG